MELHRNITIVRGDSGTGKTTLFNLIAEYTRLGSASGVNLSCDNYYILFVRENLHELPYSVEEIYEIKTSGKCHTLKKYINKEKGIYMREQFFYKYLVDITKETYQRYTKSKIESFYTIEKT